MKCLWGHLKLLYHGATPDYLDDIANTISYPTTYTGIPYDIVDNPFMKAFTTAEITNVLTTIRSCLLFGNGNIPNCMPMSVTAIGNWMVDVGDIINIVDEDGNTVPLWIFSRTLHWNGGCVDFYECTGNLERQPSEQEKRGEYQLAGQLSGKYDIVSGVSITDAGVEISGGAFLKLISGGVLDIQSSNFSISSDDMEMICGNNYFDQYGYRFEYADEDHPEQDYKFHIGQNVVLSNDTNHSELTAGGVTVDINGSNEFMPSFNFGFYSDYFSSSHRMYALISADDRILITSTTADDIELDNIYKITASSYAGTGVANNLTTTTEGKVLDARQGKTLNDKFSGYKTTQTAKSDPSASGTAVQFIDTISQNTQGVITATKKTVRTFVKSGSTAASGLVPAPSTTAGTTKFLREDATWQVALTQHQDISGKKNTQTAKSDPSADGVSTSFIATLSQNTQGVITATKKKVVESFSIPANGSKTFNIGNSYRGVFFIIGGTATAQDVITVYSTSAGAVAYQKMGSSSSLTVTTGTGTIKIANSLSYAQSCYVMTFSGSVS